MKELKDISLIIARKLLRIESKEDKDVLDQWKSKAARNSSFFTNLESFWSNPAEEESNERLNIVRERMLFKLNAGSVKKRHHPTIFYLTRIAAAIILIITIAGSSIYIASQTNLFYKNNWVEVSTEAGQQSKVTLPDGTLVWLNAETVLKYHATKDERIVSMDGEAYFEVTHAADHPFIVNTDNAKVKVLGTKFNVAHYHDSKITEASLLSGKIAMNISDQSETFELKPGEKISYNEDEGRISKIETKVQNEILWMQGILFFDNEPFNVMIQKLERYYAVKFIYNKNVYKNIHYTGSIDNLSISRVLEFINLTIPIKYEVDNKTIKLQLKE
ncbi:FecR family protein [Sunxiuqinia sp. A32]|uniref:FecR family protein n=1 Tax=Sunxiuqinia sp. A32 TaxID=3461496 RepID=UPI00404649B4